VSLDDGLEAAGVIPKGPSSPRLITSSIQRSKGGKSLDTMSVDKSKVSRNMQRGSRFPPNISTNQSTKNHPRKEEYLSNGEKKQKQRENKEHNQQHGSMSRNYTILKLRNLTKEDLESTDMTRSSFVVAKELQEMQKIDRHSAILKLQRAFAEFYRGIHLLTNYATLNSEGIEKILTKHDQNIELGDKDIYINDQLSRCGFYKRVGLTTLTRETEVGQCVLKGCGNFNSVG